MKIEFKSEIYNLGQIHLNELKRYEMINDYIYKQIQIGGCGELIERMILDYLTIKSGYTNIKKSPTNSKWDFELTDDCTVRVDAVSYTHLTLPTSDLV